MIFRDNDGILTYSLRLPTRGDSVLLAPREEWRSRALYSIGEAAFEFEQIVKEGQEHRFRIALERDVIHLGVEKALETILKRLFSYTLLIDVDVSIYSEPTRDVQNDVERYEELQSRDACFLFSGGVDSLAGAIWTQRAYPKSVAVFCSHKYQPRVISIVRTLKNSFLHQRSIPLVEIAAPALAARGYSQLRGFCYVLSAASVANSIGANSVIVSETGPTMFQPRFGVADQITTTTHPFVMDRARDTMNLLADQKIVVETPFEDKTKAEVMTICRNQKVLSMTHSCVSQRLILHDGTCYGCVIRRLAALASSAIDTEYARNPLTDSDANNGNLMALLDFCALMLLNPDELNLFQTDIIFEFNKYDLFRRFALDNFAAIHALVKDRTQLVSGVRRLYDFVISEVGTQPLEERLKELSTPTKFNEIARVHSQGL